VFSIDTMQQNLKKNIYRLYLIKIAKWFMLFMPIVVLFYQDNGLEMRHVFLLQSIYSIAIIILEIPSGYLADVLGRKQTLIIGTILGFFGFVCYSFSYGFWGFAIAEIVLGIGQSLISGADSAMLYDSLLVMGKADKYMKYEGRIISVGNFAEAIAGVLGGLLATISLRTPYYVQTFIALIGIPAAFSLIEPERHGKLVNAKFKDIIYIVRYSLVENIKLRWNIIFSSVIGASTLTMAWFVQPYFNLIDIPLSMYGILWTFLNLVVGFAAMYAHMLEHIMKPRKIFIYIAIFIPLGYVIISQINSYAGIIVLFGFYLVRGIATPVLKDYINKLTTSNIRATVLSVRNFVIRIFFAIIGPFVGWYMDKYTLSEALLVSGLIFLFLAIVTLIMQLKVLNMKE
jgi:MFS family permease